MKLIALLLAAIMLATVPADARKTKTKKFTHETVQVPAVKPQTIGINTAGTSLVLSVREDGTVHQLHYGARVDAGEFAAVPYTEGRYGSGAEAYPATGGRFLGIPALHLRYADGTHNTELRYIGHEVSEANGVTVTSVLLKDYVTDVIVTLYYEAYIAEDVIVTHTEIFNGGKKPVTLLDYASGAMSLRAGSYLLTHVSGTWAQEWQLESELLGHGVKTIGSRAGVQTSQSSDPFFLLSLDSPVLDEDSGEVVAGALAWSGNWAINFDYDVEDRLTVTGGINPYASEYPLAAGGTFATPDMIWTRSGQGAGGVSRNMHRWARKYRIYGGGTLCPILLNSWEGAYFTFNTQTILRMIDDAASMGLEMFVLDDGWFGNKYPRNSDNAGLGDWQVNTSKLPEGIGHLASYAHSKGLKFGIWIEPEMVNPASELAEQHPDWVVQSPGRKLYESRNQWVLDLSNPAVQDFVFGVFDGVMQSSPDIDYIKWDLNRMVASFGSPYLGEAQDRFFIEYTQGFYSVMRRIREKYPRTMVQCCSSGPGRVDYGELEWFNEVWTSDDTDARERVGMQHAMSMVYPACIMASHVSTVPNHQTRNVTPLKFRFDVACQGRLGLELQPKYLSDEEMALVRRCVESYKGFRKIVETGDLYRIGNPWDSDFYGSMYVTPDKSKAVVYTYCIGFRQLACEGHPFRLKGLDPSRKYKVTEQNVDESCWWGDGGVFSGAFLASGAFNPQLPALYSSAVFVLEAQ
ncbi:MAG: alpha-galactosidase [Bacteroidales bacterium]|nr:alpha-galactosidase [Bacteroidales bacterium]